MNVGQIYFLDMISMDNYIHEHSCNGKYKDNIVE